MKTCATYITEKDCGWNKRKFVGQEIYQNEVTENGELFLVDENKFWNQEIEIDVENNICSWTNTQLWLGTNIKISVSGSIRSWVLSMQPYVSCTMYQKKKHDDHISERKKILSKAYKIKRSTLN